MNTTIAGNSSPTNYYTSALAIGASSVNLVIGLPLNVYVIWLISRGPRETVASDCFSLNLAVSESFFALSDIWLLLFEKLKLTLALYVFQFSLSLVLTARPLFQSCICVDCYVGVVHPVIFLRFKPLRYRVAFCCVIWLIVLVCCLYRVFTFLNHLYLYMYFVQSVLLLCVMLFCCLSVLRALKRPGPGENDLRKKTSNAVKKRAFKIILLILTFMTMNYFIFLAVIPLQCCLGHVTFNDIIGIFTFVSLISGFLQPLLYLHRSEKLPCTGHF